MKKLVAITLIFIMCLGVCSCGTKDEKNTTPPSPEKNSEEEGVELDAIQDKKELPIKAAENYECVKTDTTIRDSGLIYTEVVDDIIYVFIEQQDTEGKVVSYEHCTFDMLEEKWTEPEKCPWSENLLKIGEVTRAFHRDGDGNWYCMTLKTSTTGRVNDNEGHFCRLNDDGTVEVIRLPEDVYGENDNMYNYEFVGDGKIMILFSKRGVASNAYKACLVNIKTNEYEELDFYSDGIIPMVIGDEFFCTSYTESFCGFLVRMKDSSQPKRELSCEVFSTPKQSATPYFVWPQVCQDEGDNVYLMYDDGIYGGYYTDKKLGTIVNENMASLMELQYKNKRTPFLTFFCRGADMVQTDFYALIATQREVGRVNFDYELVHIKAADE